MAPFFDAVSIARASTKNDVPAVYYGDVDPTWTIGPIPHGGYILALLLEAAIQEQAASAHRDPIHLTAHFLKTTRVASFEVHVRRLKAGKGFSNLTAELVQNGSACVLAHLIFGVLAPPSSDIGKAGSFALVPPSPYARIHPLTKHPAECTVTPGPEGWGFRNELNSHNMHLLKKNSPEHNGNIEWGAWVQYTNPRQALSPIAVALLADVYMSAPNTLPPKERKPLGNIGWEPTMVIAIEFKFPIPRSSSFSPRTVGIYSKGTFINDPHGRHDQYLEVWTAPSCIGEGDSKADPDWRSKQVCLATATHMALIVSLDVDRKPGKGAKAKL